MKLLSDNTLTSEQELINKLTEAGWTYQVVNTSCPRQNYKPKTIGVLKREIKNPKSQKFLTKNFPVKEETSEIPVKQGIADGVIRNYWSAKDVFDPALMDDVINFPLTSSHSLSNITSISRMRLDGRSLVLALDTEFYYLPDDQRSILSYQVAFIAPSRPDYIQELIFVSTDEKRLSLDFLIAWIIENYDMSVLHPEFSSFYSHEARRYIYHTVNNNGSIVKHKVRTISEAYAKSTLNGEREVLALSMPPNAEHRAKNFPFFGECHVHIDKNSIIDGYILDYDDFKKYALPVIILCHSGKADLSALSRNGKDDFMCNLTEIQGGLVTFREFYRYPTSISKYWVRHPVKITVRDTMCFSPTKNKSLYDLGKTIGIPKLDLSDTDKNNMLDYLRREPVKFADYAINDSVITLCYAGELWGYNTDMPLTVSSAAVKAALPVICNYFGIPADGSRSSLEAYNKAFRGLFSVKKGLIARFDQPSFLANTSLESINDNARILQTYAKHAFKGGFNASTTIGKFDGIETHDFDLESAYPTSMSLVPDIDWSGAVLVKEIMKRKITLDDFNAPNDPLFGYIRFRFPETVMYPTIPVHEDGSIVFPLSSEGLDGVYASGPEIYLALQLGAEVWAEHVYVGSVRINNDGIESHSLYAVASQFVKDRNLAKELYGKNSLPEQFLKYAVCSLYGKIAQNINEKQSWNAFHDRMEKNGCSVLTSPVHASMTTSLVRCILLGAINELHILGYKIYSVTTDGFITNAPKDVLDNLSLFGFADYFRSARNALVGSEEMWSEKHHQSDLLNFTTRGNVSLSSEGVCAHNSFVTGYEKDSYEDRLALMTVVLGRTDRCHCKNPTWTKFKKLVARQNRADFAVTEQDRAISMDFDLKRKPIKSSMKTVFPVVENETFEIVNFDTEPYATVAEYRKYKKVSKSCTCLRTEKDWDLFYAKVECKDKSTTCRITDLEWAKLRSCIMAYRLGIEGCDIPYLNNKTLSVKDKVTWINQFNKSQKKFTENDWKNCNRKERKSQMLDKAFYNDLLITMQNWSLTHDYLFDIYYDTTSKDWQHR